VSVPPNVDTFYFGSPASRVVDAPFTLRPMVLDFVYRVALSPLRALSSVFSVILGGLGLGWAPARKVGGMTNQYGWRASP
jgi:hypothetical protein